MRTKLAPLSFVCTVGVLGSSSLASAQRPDELPSRAPGAERLRTGSYRKTILIVDLASFVAMSVGGAAQSDVISMIGTGGFFLGSSVVHVHHSRHGRALGSVALRLLPVAGFVAVVAASDDYAGLEAGVIVAMLLMGIGVGIDYWALARGDDPPDTEKPKPPGTVIRNLLPGVTWQPTLNISSHGVTAAGVVLSW